MLIGLIKSYNTFTKSGIIGSRWGDFFFKLESFKEKPKELEQATAIIFAELFDINKRRNTAVNCRTVSTLEDFYVILESLTHYDNILIEKEIRGVSRHGNPYLRIELRDVVVKISAKNQLFEKLDVKVIKSYIIDYFEKELNMQSFITFCEFIEKGFRKTYYLPVKFGDTEEIRCGFSEDSLLSQIYTHFRSNLNDRILFDVWKSKKYKYLAYANREDCQIALEQLIKFANEIGIDELKRIKEQGLGLKFCRYLIKSQAISFGNINNIEDFNKYNTLKELLEFETDETKSNFIQKINELIIAKGSENFKVELWLYGIIENIPFELIENEFLSCDDKIKTLVLEKLSLTEQFNLLKVFKAQYNFEKTFKIIDSYVKHANSLPHYTGCRQILFDKAFLNDKVGKELISLFNNYFKQNANDEEKYNFFFKGLSEDAPLALILANVPNSSKYDYQQLLSRYSDNQTFIYDLLKEKTVDGKKDDLDWIVTFAKDYLDSKYFSKFDSELNKILNRTEYYQLWELGKVNILPEKYIVQNAIALNREKCENILKRATLNQSFIFELLKIKVLNAKPQDLNWMIVLAKEYLYPNFFEKFDNELNAFLPMEEYFKFWESGLVNIFPEYYITQNVGSFYKTQIEKILNNEGATSIFIYNILLSKILIADKEDLKWLGSLAKLFLDTETFVKFDKELFELIPKAEYYKLLAYGDVGMLDESYMLSTLNENYEDYIKLNIWITQGFISTKKVIKFILTYLEDRQNVTDRIIFYRHLNHIKYLLELDATQLEKVEQLGNEFYSIILWVFGTEVLLDYELLISKFIYFSPDDQIQIIRKLFSLIAKDERRLTIYDLNKLLRIDLDLYRTNQKFNPEIPLDISTEIILNALLNYTEKNKFLVEGELLSIVLKSIDRNKKKKFKLGNYFEDCKGISNAYYDWQTNGEITKTKSKSVKGSIIEYFSISLDQNTLDEDKFKFIEEELKKIPGSKLNTLTYHWGVPLKFENELLEFARKNKILLNFEGSKNENNTHLVRFFRDKRPNGITYCEGRLANKRDYTFNKEFWWCGGKSRCFQNCQTLHRAEKWESYTLLDFCEILGLITDTTNIMGDVISKGNYYQFIGLINRFNQLLDRLYCTQCDEILHPIDTSYFAAYNVVRFCCENEKCGQYKTEIYLNHCLNSQCNSIIDSRVSQKCNNGLFICPNCGSCCSQTFFVNRLNSLDTVDNFDNEKKIWVYNDTKRKQEYKLGHLDKGEYFCYKCGDPMEETAYDIFNCKKCNTKYDTTKYHFKRENKHLSEIKLIPKSPPPPANDNFYDDLPF